MKTQQLLIVLTAINLGLSLFLLSKAGFDAEAAPSVLRGSALEIVDSAGRLRATSRLNTLTFRFTKSVSMRTVSIGSDDCAPAFGGREQATSRTSAPVSAGRR